MHRRSMEAPGKGGDGREKHCRSQTAMCPCLRSCAGPTVRTVGDYMKRLVCYALCPRSEPEGTQRIFLGIPCNAPSPRLRRLRLRRGKPAGLIDHCMVRRRRTGLDLSATSVESSDHLATVHDQRDGTPALGVLKHLLHPRGVLGDVDVLKGNLPFAVVLTGGRGVGSSVLAEDQRFLSHPRQLLV
jgi:hypothetical protein